jgi:asparagine synthase (glutamine-hydrolysing)
MWFDDLDMCGICGSTRDPDGSSVAAMKDHLLHRGPDDEGLYRDEHTGLTLGVRRLSVIDVAGGHQPVSNEDGTVWAMLNGEIYNHPSLREHLLARGHKFRSRADTEVLVHLYEEYGDALVHALDGMFAFVLWDASKRRLLLARDRFGEKPLFYYEKDGVLTFASELTALLEGARIPHDLDPEAVDSYFVFGYVPGPGSMVPGVKQLLPAHRMVWEPNRPSVAIDCYWQPMDVAVMSNESVRELTEETGRLLRASVKSRLIADVPLGVLLSGGIDSSLIAVLAAEVSQKPIKTFTVGYDVGGVAETGSARRTARELGSDHHELVLSEADVATRAPELLARLDQPLADQALVATHAIAEFARREVTVGVGGEGADELFGGYPRYRWLRRAALLDGVPRSARVAAAELVGALPARGRVARLAPVLMPQPTLERHIDWVTSGRRHFRPRIYGRALESMMTGDRIGQTLAARADASFVKGAPDAAMRLDQVHWLPDDVLVKADRASMLNSLELRTPYLSRELAEFAASIPATAHTSGDGKRFLRALARSVGISAASRAKTAFRVPAGEWLRGPLAPALAEQLRSGSLFERELMNREFVGRCVAAHNQRTTDWTDVLWPVLALGLWADRFWAANDG